MVLLEHSDGSPSEEISVDQVYLSWGLLDYTPHYAYCGHRLCDENMIPACICDCDSCESWTSSIKKKRRKYIFESPSQRQ